MAIQQPPEGDQTQQLVSQILPLLDALSQQPGVDEGQIAQCIEVVSQATNAMPGGEMPPEGGEMGPAGPGYDGGSFEEATAAVRQFEDDTGNLPEREDRRRQRRGQG